MNNEDLNNDEIRRQLRAVDRMNNAVVPRWREALPASWGRRSARHRREGHDPRRAVPNRRISSTRWRTILGVAVLAACGSDDDDTAATTPGTTAGGTTPPTTPATTPATEPMTTMADSGEMDLVLARTAASLEKLAVDAYGAAGGLLTTPAVIDAATMFAGHHQMHLDALNGVITGAGGRPSRR